MHERNKVLVNPLIELGQPPIPEIPLAADARGRYLLVWTYDEKNKSFTVYFDDGVVEDLTGNLSDQNKQLDRLIVEAGLVNRDKNNKYEKKRGKPGKRP